MEQDSKFQSILLPNKKNHLHFDLKWRVLNGKLNHSHSRSQVQRLVNIFSTLKTRHLSFKTSSCKLTWNSQPDKSTDLVKEWITSNSEKVPLQCGLIMSRDKKLAQLVVVNNHMESIHSVLLERRASSLVFSSETPMHNLQSSNSRKTEALFSVTSPQEEILIWISSSKVQQSRLLPTIRLSSDCQSCHHIGLWDGIHHLMVTRNLMI